MENVFIFSELVQETAIPLATTEPKPRSSGVMFLHLT